MRRPRLIVPVLVLGAVFAPLASAVTCTVGATSLAFGSFNPLAGGNIDSTATVSVQCNTAIALFFSFQVQLTIGTGTSYLTRQMASGSNRLNYNLYTDAARTLIFGTGSGGTSRINFGELISIGNLNRSYTVYGRVPSQTTAKPGTYSDSITVNVIY